MERTAAALVKQRAIASNKWSVLATLTPRLVTPFAAVLLAYYLAPADYGIVAVSVIFVSLAQLFLDAGLGRSLMQRHDRLEDCKNATFWISAALGAVLSLSVFFSAGSISRFFNIPEVRDVLRVQCWQMLLMSLGTTHLALCRKEFDYARLARLMLISSLPPFVVALPLAAVGFRYWSLVWSSLAMSALQTLLLWRAVCWRPRFSFQPAVAKEIVYYAGFIALEGLTAWCMSRGDRLALGHFTDPETLGLYAYGANLVVLAISTIDAPFNSDAFFSACCHLASARTELLSMLRKNVTVYSLFLFPFCLGVTCTADLALPLVFNTKWNGLAQVVSVLIVSPGLVQIISPYSHTLKAINRPDILPKIFASMMLVAMPVYFLCAAHGLTAFLWGRFGLELLCAVPATFAVSRALNVPVKTILEPMAVPAASAALMAFAVRVFIIFARGDLGRPSTFACAILLGCSIYLACIALFKRSLIAETYTLFRRALLPAKYGYS